MANSHQSTIYSTDCSYLPDGIDEELDMFDVEVSERPAPSLSDNQCKIKIIPSLGFQAGMNNQDFDIILDANSAKWYKQVMEAWKTYKKSPILSALLQKYYHVSANAFIFGLKFFANAPDATNPKSNSLSFTILDELAKFKRNFLQTGQNFNDFVDQNLKMVVFNFLKNSGQQSTFRLAVNLFELKDKNVTMFVEPMREMLKAKRFKEIGNIACDLGLYDQFTIEDFVIPLILSDKLTIVEEYLDKATALRKPTIQLLDSFLARDSSVQQETSHYIDKYDLYNDVKKEKLHKKPLSKLILRLCEKYGVETSFTPNVTRQKSYGALKYLLQKYYSEEKTFNQQSFGEVIRETVSEHDKELQGELVYSCFAYGDTVEAARWAKYYKLPLSDVPFSVREYISSNGATVDLPPPKPSSNRSEKLHTLKLDDSQLVMVDSADEFWKMLETLRQEEMVAFDSEWKPKFMGNSEICLIQLSTRSQVFLVDVISLNEIPLTKKEWSHLGTTVFINEEILKLGFAHDTDLQMMEKWLPGLNIQIARQTSQSYLDLQLLWREAVEVPGFTFPFHPDFGATEQSLSNLVKLCLGTKLDKSNQLSNWQQRPLRKEQISYAALDAFCLFECYDVMQQQFAKLPCDFDNIVSSVLTDKKSKHTARKGSSGGSESVRRKPMR